MNLKSYLRGVGLGLIVAALLLGIHHARTSNATLSDDEIRARAARLGMVDGSSRLVEDEDVSAEDLLESIDEQEEDTQDIDVTNVTNDSSDTETTETDSETADSEAQQSDEDIIATAEAFLQDELPDVTTDADDDPGLDYPTEEDTTAIIETQTESPDTTVTESADSSAGNTAANSGTFTISSGDSSDRVARKLADAGFVSDAASYDRFLCSHGYDRVIRTGTYNITAGMTEDEIARLITGR